MLSNVIFHILRDNWLEAVRLGNLFVLLTTFLGIH